MYQKEFLKDIDVAVKEEFLKLTPQEQYLYNMLKESKIVEVLRKTNFNNKYNMLNFKTTKESNRTYFSFDIIETLETNNCSEISLKVEGSVISNFQGTNIVYIVTDLKNKGLQKLYVENYINVNNNAILNEITYINAARQISRVEYVCLTIKKFPVEQSEEFIIDADSDICKLYFNRQIDATTLCNLALLQAHKQFEQEKQTSFTKQIGRRFI